MRLDPLKRAEIIEQARSGKKISELTYLEIENYIRDLEEIICDTDWAIEILKPLVNSAK